MSRSYKKSPWYTDGGAGGPKSSKREANKKIRHLDFDELPMKGKTFKKYYCSYDIHDYKSLWTYNEAVKDWESKECYHDRYDSFDEYIKHWAKFYKRK